MFYALLAYVKLLSASTYGTSTYGSGSFSSVLASSTNVQIGPITLPVTGSGLLVIMGCLGIAVAAGLVVWLHQRRSKSSAATITD